MRVYSKDLNLFTRNSELKVKDILSKECGVQVRKTRFLYNGYLYPIKVMAYEDERENNKQTLAYFDSNYYSIKINVTLSKLLSDQDFENLLRHEIAHYLCYLDYGSSIQAHGQEYIQKCKSYSWGENVFKAHYPLDKIQENIEKKENLSKKYQKLMNLGQNTSNVHEASLALKKASELVLKHGEFDSGEDEQYYVMDLFNFKKKTSKLMAIYNILEQMHFGVCFHYGNETHALETYGPKKIVIQAKVIFDFLEQSMNFIWELEKSQFKDKKKSLITYKNSFFNGFSEGVCLQLKKNELNYNKDLENALIALKFEISKAKDLIYKRFSYSKKSSNSDQSAKNLGFRKGLKFNLNFKKHKYIQG